MTYIDFHMKMFGWFYRWRTHRDSILKMRLRSRDEILIKRQEFANKLLLSQKNGGETSKYENYIEVMKWILRET